MTHRNLTDRQGLFAREYLVDLNATQAAIRAGYARDSASRRGWALRRHPRVAEQIDAALADRAEAVEITAERVLLELALLGFANIKDYFETGADGAAWLAPSALTREQAAAITEVQVDEGGAAGGGARRVKIKLADKSRNLELIGKHLGMFARTASREKAKDEEATGRDVKMSDTELAQRILTILVRGRKAGADGS